LMDARSAVKSFLSTDKDFALVHDLIQFNGRPFSQAVTDKVLAMIDAGNDAEPLFNFLRNVRQNPSSTAQDELLLFCVANQFMITTDGHILAYKSVRGNYTDIHSGKFDNSVGNTVMMERNAVDDNREQTCSTGLHFASHEYASTWAGDIDGVNRRLMVMKVNPRDVVSIPSDYNNQKGRCCKYEVIAELNGGKALPKAEVYDETDLFGDGHCHGRCDLQEDELRAELDRKQALLDKTISKSQGLQERIERIYNDGGAPGNALYSQADRALELIDELNDEIAELEAVLEAF